MLHLPPPGCFIHPTSLTIVYELNTPMTAIVKPAHPGHRFICLRRLLQTPIFLILVFLHPLQQPRAAVHKSEHARYAVNVPWESFEVSSMSREHQQGCCGEEEKDQQTNIDRCGRHVQLFDVEMQRRINGPAQMMCVIMVLVVARSVRVPYWTQSPWNDGINPLEAIASVTVRDIIGHEVLEECCKNAVRNVEQRIGIQQGFDVIVHECQR